MFNLLNSILGYGLCWNVNELKFLKLKYFADKLKLLNYWIRTALNLSESQYQKNLNETTLIQRLFSQQIQENK